MSTTSSDKLQAGLEQNQQNEIEPPRRPRITQKLPSEPDQQPESAQNLRSRITIKLSPESDQQLEHAQNPHSRITKKLFLESDQQLEHAQNPRSRTTIKLLEDDIAQVSSGRAGWRKKASFFKKSKRVRRPISRRRRVLSWAFLILILATILLPAGFLINFSLNAYTTYHQLNDQAHKAVNQLLKVKTIYDDNKANPASIFKLANLQQAKSDFEASSQAFQLLENQLQHSSSINAISTYLPQYQKTIQSARAASAIGKDVAHIGQIAVANAMQFSSTFSQSLLSTSKQPLITQPMLDTLGTTIQEILPLLNDIQAHSQDLSLNALPISSAEKQELGQVLQQLPQFINMLTQVHGMLDTLGWVLGVGQTRSFLVQTMDRAELRGTGGFTGQYGELTIDSGRVAPFSLRDISLLEYTGDSVTLGQLTPVQYRSWWPFPNWGLRDSNISADFPTSAQLATKLYHQESGLHVDGVISFTPVVIEHILSVIGPIPVPGYNTTVTAQNLEDLLHYYQLNNSGIAKEVTHQSKDTSTSIRKRFTGDLASLLITKLRGTSFSNLLTIAHLLLSDLKTKDLQIYFTNPTAENLLIQYNDAGQMDRSLTHDGLFVVQQNLSASKASQYVQTILHDTVTLDSQGGATHLLQMSLVYNQAGSVYGYDTYYDYVRVYVPPASKLLWGDGFSTGTPLCGGAYGDCPVNGPYSQGELDCPSGQYQPGATPPNLTGSDGASWQPLQTLGGPTNTSSDEPGKAMYGGWVIVPKNCTMNVTLSWYVPPLSQGPYSLLVQRQAGTFPELDLTIQPTASDCAQLRTGGLHFSGLLTRDTTFTPALYHPTKSQAQSCYPQQGV